MSTRIYSDNGLLQKWKFLRKVMEDHNLTLADRSVAAQLLFHHNTKTGKCFPGEKRMADAIGISERQVRRSVAQLKKTKWLASVTPRYDSSNLYAFNWCNEANTDQIRTRESKSIRTQEFGHLDSGVLTSGLRSPKVEDSGVRLTSEDNERRIIDKDNHVRKDDDDDSFSTEDEDEEAVRMFETLMNGKDTSNTKESSPAGSNTKNDSLPDYAPKAFEVFWKVYPYKTNKEPARKEFYTAIRNADVNLIIRRAKRYAEEVAETKPDFIHYPVKWLREAHWEDQYKPTAMDLLAESQAQTRAIHERAAREREKEAEKTAQELQDEQSFAQDLQSYAEEDQPAEDDSMEDEPFASRGPVQGY
jgi:hypothetical protein